MTDRAEAWMLLDGSTLSSHKLFCTLCPNKEVLQPISQSIGGLSFSPFRNFSDPRRFTVTVDLCNCVSTLVIYYQIFTVT